MYSSRGGKHSDHNAGAEGLWDSWSKVFNGKTTSKSGIGYRGVISPCSRMGMEAAVGGWRKGAEMALYCTPMSIHVS